MSDAIGVSLAFGWNKIYGVPTNALFVIQQIVNVIDGGFNSFPAYVFFGKVVP